MRSFILSLLFLILFSLPAIGADRINSFDVDIYLDRSGWIKVEENIRYDFGDTYRHGIFREIPYRYKKDGHNYNLDIKVQDVKKIEGTSYKFTTSRSNGKLNIKIGDPSKTVTGANSYIIEYSVENAILYFEKYDEFYWNATGNEWWNIPIIESSAKIYLPDELPPDVMTQCFTGRFGSKSSDCSINENRKTVEFITNGVLSGGEGLTIDISVPKGYLKEPSFISKAFRFIKQNFFYSLPVFVLVFLVGFWKYEGRDPYRKNSLAVRYEPPEELSPAEAGTLFDERADMVDITSTVIDLAVRGFLKIEEFETTKFLFLSDRDYKLIKLKDVNEPEMKRHESRILNGLFTGSKKEVLVSELKNNFYKNLPEIEKSLFKQLTDTNHFPSNPENIRKIFKYFGIGTIVLSLTFLPFFQYKIVGAVCGILFVIFSRFMPRKTRKGAITNNHILGFREFIDRVETDRIKRMASEDPTVFDRILPYALVFGLEEKWAKAFEGLFTEPPKWYYSPNYSGTFNSHVFINDLGRSISIMNKSFYSSPRNANGSRGISAGGFGGGGFSGGGFGGGGGGSW